MAEDSQVYNNFYDEYEKNFKENFSLKFGDCEQQRLKENFLYKIKAIIYFILIPLIIYFIASKIIVSHISDSRYLFIIQMVLFICLASGFTIKVRKELTVFVVFISFLLSICLVVNNLDLILTLSDILLFIATDTLIFLDFRTKCNKNFMNKIKVQIMYDLLKSIHRLRWFGHDYDKNKSGSIISDVVIKKSNLFLPYNTRFIDDEFQGVYNDVPFEISETNLYRITKEKMEIKTKVFRGVIIKFKTNKNAKAGTIVTTKKNLTQQSEFLLALIFFSALFILFLCGLIIPTSPISDKILFLIASVVLIPFLLFEAYKKQKGKFKKINLEDADFEKIFNVYSSDQVEARYLLTTAFMERFKNIQTSFGAKIVKCSFFEDNLMIAITTDKNLFEIGSLYKSFYDEDLMKQFFSELESIYKMVEYFKLDEKTGL